jgi:UDP-N-acetylglucosamine 3-dehydrogenase
MFRVAMVGAGGMATMHTRCYSQLPDAGVVSVMDIRGEAAKKLADSVGAAAYDDFDNMLAETRPDIVDVCVPTPWHADYVCRAAETGLHGIVVEKPMGRTVADCERMIAACESAGVPLFVAHVLRFFPEFAAAKAQVDAGAVGEMAAVRTRRGGPFPRAWENWYGKLDWSGGLVLDLIIHDFDWLRWTFGEVERVYAKGLAGKAGAGAEVEQDYALVTLRFKSGAVGHVEGTWADPGGFKVSFEIAGDQGLLEYNFNQPASPPFVAALAASDGERVGVPVPESPTAANPYQLELEHFLYCLKRGVPAGVTPRDGLEAARIALAALESIRTGKPVTL